MPSFHCCALLCGFLQGEAGAPAPATPLFVTLREHTGSGEGAGFGHGLAFLGDVDRDGVVDYAIGAPRDPARTDSEGSVAVHSGKTGALLFLHRGLGHGSGFGFAVAGGDCNGDGIADVVVSAPYASNEGRAHAGNVQFFSGKDGRLLREVWGTTDGEAFGWSVAALADVDGDGATDYAIGAPYADRARGKKAPDIDAGRVDVHSGKRGRVLFTVWGEAAEDRFGWSTARVDDCNGDGIPDLLIGAEGATRGKERPGSATLLSAKNGDSIVRVLGDSGTYFGTAVCGLGDVDGDARPDVAVGAWNAGDEDKRTGEVRILPCRGGKPIHVLRGVDHLDQFGRALANVGDIDGDGVADLAIGAPSEHAGGYVRIVSGRTLAVLFELRGSLAGERFGATLRAADIDGDGTLELLAGDSAAGRVVLLGRKQ